MLINFTNHPSKDWSQEQLEAAQKYGEIYDLPFPNIDPNAEPGDLIWKAADCVSAICQLNPSAVLCQGEPTFNFIVVDLLKNLGLPVFAACSKRETIEQRLGDKTIKTSIYKFVKFRNYF